MHGCRTSRCPMPKRPSRRNGRFDAPGLAGVVLGAGATTITVDEQSLTRRDCSIHRRRARRGREGRAVDRRCDACRRYGRGAGRSCVSRRACRRHRRPRGDERLRRDRHRLRAVRVRRRPADMVDDASAVDRLHHASSAARLHADGRTLSVSVPYIKDDERTDDSGYLGVRLRRDAAARRSDPDHGVRLLHRQARADRSAVVRADRRSTLRNRRSTTTASWRWASRCTDTTGRSLRLVLVRPIKKVRPA